MASIKKTNLGLFFCITFVLFKGNIKANDYATIIQKSIVDYIKNQRIKVYQELIAQSVQDKVFITQKEQEQFFSQKINQHFNAYNEFQKLFKPNSNINAHYFPTATYDSLNVISSSPTRTSWFSMFDSMTETACGSTILTQMLMQPATINVLQKRQAIIKHLKNQIGDKTINSAVKEIHKNLEGYLAIYSDQQKTIQSGIENHHVSKADYINNALYYKYLGDNSISQGIGQVLTIGQAAAKTAIAPLVMYGGFQLIKNQGLSALNAVKDGSASKMVQEFAQNNLIGQTIGSGAHMLSDVTGSDKLGAAAVMAANGYIGYEYLKHTGNWALDKAQQLKDFSVSGYNEVTAQSDWLNYIHEQLIQMGSIARQLQILDKTLIAPNKKIQELLPSLLNIRALFDQESTIISPEMRSLIGNLLTNTFTGKPSYFSNHGRVVSSYKTMQKCYQEFIPVFRALGELDAYMACTKVYFNSLNTDQPFTLVEISDAKKPYFEVQNLWDTKLESKDQKPKSISTVVAQNIIIESKDEYFITDSKEKLQAIMRAIILGNTLGIMPCQQAIMTPFANIITIDNKEDLMNNDSVIKNNDLSAIAYDGTNLTSEENMQILNTLISPVNVIFAASPVSTQPIEAIEAMGG